MNDIFLLFRWRRWLRPDCKPKLWRFCSSIYRRLASSSYRQLSTDPVRTVCYKGVSWRYCAWFIGWMSCMWCPYRLSIFNTDEIIAALLCDFTFQEQWTLFCCLL